MKLTNVTYAGAVLATLALSACSNDLDKNSEWGNNGIRFTSYIAGPTSRVVNGQNLWENGDKVGIFMPAAGQQATTQAEYTADVKGALTPARTALNYPEDGSAVDFIAYYPYDANAKGTTSVDVSDQTKKIDLLYAKESNHKKGDATVNLGFKHQLSYVVLNISGKDGASVAGVQVALQGTKTAGTFDLNAGTLTTTDSSVKDIKFTTSADGTKSEAIVLPAQSLTGAKLAFTLDGKTVIKDFTNVTSFAASTKYSINVTISNGGTPGGDLTVSFGNATITDWTSGTVTGNIDVDFGGGSETPDPDPQPGVTTTIFNETFGASVDKKDNGYWPAINEYTGYNNKSLTFTDPQQVAGGFEFSQGSIRQTTTMDPHVWLPANKDSQLQIAGFTTADYKNLTLSYDITANKADVDQNIIKVYAGDKEITVPSKAISQSNTYQTVTLSNLPAGITSIMFASSKDTNTAGYRIDNIKLVGTK